MVGQNSQSGQRMRPKYSLKRFRTNGNRSRIYAALDLGTNSCRLLVARSTRRTFRVIDAFSRIVYLGEGLEGHYEFSQIAMDRTFEALRICALKIKKNKVDVLRCVATEACRRASNIKEFVNRVEVELGLKLETISWDEEARLALNGCASLFDRKHPYGVMFDIGGGSTELIWVKGESTRIQMFDSISIPHGVLNISERYGEEAISQGAYDQIVDEISGFLKIFCRRHKIYDVVSRGEVQMLGASGTMTTIASVCMGLSRYQRSMIDGAILSFDEVKLTSQRLRFMTSKERTAHPCIGQDRAKLVVAGCAVVEAIMRQWPVGSIRVADRGIREGMLF